MKTQLNDLLLYKNNSVINRYKIDYKNNVLSPEEVFSELLKYLWLTQKHKLDKEQSPSNIDFEFICAVHKEMVEIDDMWHTFILFTKDYMSFCENFFGNYIHHIPTTESDAPITKDEFEATFTRYLSYIYDNLGEQTVISWFNSLN